MNTPDPVSTPPTAIPWWESKIIQRLALSIVVQILAATHLSKCVAGVDLAGLVDQILEAIGVAYAAWAVHARATKPIPAVAISRAAAEKTNAAVGADQNPTTPPPAANPNP